MPFPGSDVASLSARPRARHWALLVAGTCPLLLAPPREVRKLNGPLATMGLGDVGPELVASPDGARVVYTAGVGAGPLELFSVPADGSAPPIELHPPLVAGRNVVAGTVAISPDGARVVYRADQDTNDVFELYSAPIDGSADPVKLNGPLVLGTASTILEARISPDGARVVYLADQDTNDFFELYSVPIDGSASAVQLSQATSPNQHHVDPPIITPDSQYVVFCAFVGGPQGLKLFRAPIDGAQAPILLDFRTSNGPQASPDGARIVYGVVGEAGGWELWSIPVDGSQFPVELSAPFPPGGGVEGTGSDRVRFSPDGGTVVYLSDQDATDVFELYSVPTDGSAPSIVLNHALTSGSDVQFTFANERGFAVTPDGARVLYVANDVQQPGVPLELFSVPIDRSEEPVPVSGSMVASGDLFGPFRIAPDSSRLVFLADREVDELNRLYAAPADGSGPPVGLDGPFVLTGDVSVFRLLGNERAAYLADQESIGVLELFAAPLDASSNSIKLNDPFPVGSVTGDVLALAISPDFRRAVYTGSEGLPGMIELYSADLETPAERVRLNDLPSLNGDVVSFEITPDSSHVIYRFQTKTPSGNFLETTLHGVPIDRATGPVQLHPPLVSGGNVTAFDVSPVGSAVVFRADAEVDGVFRLYASPPDGGAPPDELSGAVGFRDVYEFAISPAGDRVAFTADLVTDEEIVLFSVPLDGSSAPIELSGTLPAVSDVSQLAVSPDGARVVFMADRDVDTLFELFSVPIDGSEAPVKLNGPLVAGGSILFSSVRIVSARVVYNADQLVNDQLELFSVPIAGGPAIVLNPPLVAGGDVSSDFELTSGGATVVYRADQATDERIELFAVGTDGSSSAVQIGAPMPVGGDVRDFRIAPDGTRVVYRADPITDGMIELFNTPITGGDVQKLSGELLLLGSVHSGYLVSADSSRVVFRANLDSNFVTKLFRAPIDGGASPDRVNSSLIPGGDVRDFALDEHGERVVYLADQEFDERVELYLSRPADPFRRVPGPTETVFR